MASPPATYSWHVVPGGVLVVVDLNRDGWRSVANDAAGVIDDLAELRPDLLSRVPLILYQDSSGRWDALHVDPQNFSSASCRLTLPARPRSSPACCRCMAKRKRDGAGVSIPLAESTPARTGNLVGYARVSTRDQTVAL